MRELDINAFFTKFEDRLVKNQIQDVLDIRMDFLKVNIEVVTLFTKFV